MEVIRYGRFFSLDLVGSIGSADPGPTSFFSFEQNGEPAMPSTEHYIHEIRRDHPHRHISSLLDLFTVLKSR